VYLHKLGLSNCAGETVQDPAVTPTVVRRDPFLDKGDLEGGSEGGREEGRARKRVDGMTTTPPPRAVHANRRKGTT